MDKLEDAAAAGLFKIADALKELPYPDKTHVNAGGAVPMSDGRAAVIEVTIDIWTLKTLESKQTP